MNKNDFKKMLNEFEAEFIKVNNSENLQQLKENYIKLELVRESVFDSLFEKVLDTDERGEFLKTFSKFEYEIPYSIPLFGNDDLDTIDSLFEDYNGYFQRFGCLNAEQIISWSDTEVLFDDEFGNIDIVTRPDTLVGKAE
jgi:hypothetical protein